MNQAARFACTGSDGWHLLPCCFHINILALAIVMACLYHMTNSFRVIFLWGMVLMRSVVSCVTVKPDKGDALLFFSLHLDASTDPLSLHGSCPVIEGEKWSATKWIHVRDFDKPMKRRDDGECVDENVNCSKWAKLGECDKNSLYMVGNEEVKGFCMKSCNVC